MKGKGKGEGEKSQGVGERVSNPFEACYVLSFAKCWACMVVSAGIARAEPKGMQGCAIHVVGGGYTIRMKWHGTTHTRYTTQIDIGQCTEQARGIHFTK
jgi:hypothetical protein